jgi:arylsulfatase A-like enzyme
LKTARTAAVAALGAIVLASAAAARPGPERGSDARSPAAGARALAADERPNILVILTDDQRDDEYLPVMPNVRRLFARGGTRFANAYATTPLCCPSRGSIFSGRYAHNHGILTNNTFSQVMGFDQTTSMQCHLQPAGYHTAIAGKLFNIWPLGQSPPCWDRWAVSDEGYVDPEFNVNGVRQTVPGYSTELLGNLAIDDLQAFEADDAAPWFLYVATYAPHFPYTPEAAYADAPVRHRRPNPALTEADRTDKPREVQTWGLNPKKGAHVRRVQLRTLMSVDDMVGDVFAQLDALGEEERTLAIFLSDNGLLWAEHGLYGTKRYPYLPSVDIPMFLRWPGNVAVGVVDDRLAANIDIAPTVFDAAGLSPPIDPPMDGASLLEPTRRDRLLLEYFRSPDNPVLGEWAGTITHRYEYIEYYADDGTTITFREYYDLVRDPWQLRNLLGDRSTRNDPDVAPLHAQLSADRACEGASCPT